MRLLNRIASRLGLKTDRVERFVALARTAIAWERVWPALWPATGIVGLCLAAALFDLFAYVPAWLHMLALAAALGAAGGTLYLRLRNVRSPAWREGARRLERDSHLAHRPITERDDTLAAGRDDPLAEALWRTHVKRLLASIEQLRVALPSPGLPARDPYALRFVVLLAVVAGFAVAGHDWDRRLANAFLPVLGTGGPAARLDAWINPPAYTGEAPVYLENAAARDETVSVPAGSKLVLRVHGAHGTPRIRFSPEPKKPAAFKGEDGEYAADVALTRTADVAVDAGGRRLGAWHIQAVPDSPPVIAFSEPPSRTERNAVKFAFTAGDDYGVVKVRAIILPVKRESKARKPLIVDLSVDNPRAKALKQVAYKDLTEHPYAGLKVTVTLEATDGAGQTGRSKPVAFTLPARIFTNPLARALIEQRQNLAVGDIAAVPKAQRTLDALTIAPERFYNDKAGVYTAIRAAYWGLRAAHVRADITRVQDLLWQTAVALEEGGLSAAAEMLRRLQQMLSQALMSGAPQAKIDELLQRYKQALDRYLQMLARNAQRGNKPLPPNAKVMNPQDLQDLLNAIQKLAQTGARNQAAQMLAMLQNMLENLHMSAGNGQGQQSPRDKAASDAIKRLGDLMGRQRELLDKTYREGQDAGDPKDGGGPGLSRKQGQLREDLNKVLKGLGDQGVPAPMTLGEAGRSMGEAQGELGRKDFDSAGDAQKDALDALRRGAGELAQNLMRESQQGMQRGNEDPLGRAEGGRGTTLGGNVKVPDKSALERAREILKELRKRAAERGRPKEELDYIDRLLRQF
jgi:uncharacterized protein (TIGR02302 family)